MHECKHPLGDVYPFVVRPLPAAAAARVAEDKYGCCGDSSATTKGQNSENKPINASSGQDPLLQYWHLVTQTYDPPGPQ